jgi:hypothetical protein
MSDVIRKFFSRLNRSVAENVSARRHKFRVPIKVTIDPNRGATGKLTVKKDTLSISGETEDLSKTGIAFLVSSIRLREYYLVGEDRVLHVELDLPNGRIRMDIVGVRYEQVGIHDSTVSFLIGAKIVQIGALEKEVYEEYLRLGNKVKKVKAQDFSLEPEN